MTELSNSLADLAERIKEANGAVLIAERTTAEKALEAGRLLCTAKDECNHGEWLPFLQRAGVHERQARRLMQLARSGLTIGNVSDLGGIKAAYEHLSARRLPEDGECLLISRKGWTETDDPQPLACVSPAKGKPGFYNVSILDLTAEPGWTSSLTKPVRGEPIRMADGSFLNGLWTGIDLDLTVPPAEREFIIVPDQAEDVFRDVVETRERSMELYEAAAARLVSVKA